LSVTGRLIETVLSRADALIILIEHDCRLVGEAECIILISIMYSLRVTVY